MQCAGQASTGGTKRHPDQARSTGSERRVPAYLGHVYRFGPAYCCGTTISEPKALRRAQSR
jgi:hypothetical protein